MSQLNQKQILKSSPEQNYRDQQKDSAYKMNTYETINSEQIQQLNHKISQNELSNQQYLISSSSLDSEILYNNSNLKQKHMKEAFLKNLKNKQNQIQEIQNALQVLQQSQNQKLIQMRQLKDYQNNQKINSKKMNEYQNQQEKALIRKEIQIHNLQNELEIIDLREQKIQERLAIEQDKINKEIEVNQSEIQQIKAKVKQVEKQEQDLYSIENLNEIQTKQKLEQMANKLQSLNEKRQQAKQIESNLKQYLLQSQEELQMTEEDLLLKSVRKVELVAEREEIEQMLENQRQQSGAEFALFENIEQVQQSNHCIQQLYSNSSILNNLVEQYQSDQSQTLSLQDFLKRELENLINFNFFIEILDSLKKQLSEQEGEYPIQKSCPSSPTSSQASSTFSHYGQENNPIYSYLNSQIQAIQHQPHINLQPSAVISRIMDISMHFNFKLDAQLLQSKLKLDKSQKFQMFQIKNKQFQNLQLKILNFDKIIHQIHSTIQNILKPQVIAIKNTIDSYKQRLQPLYEFISSLQNKIAKHQADLEQVKQIYKKECDQSYQKQQKLQQLILQKIQLEQNQMKKDQQILLLAQILEKIEYDFQISFQKIQEEKDKVKQQIKEEIARNFSQDQSKNQHFEQNELKEIQRKYENIDKAIQNSILEQEQIYLQVNGLRAKLLEAKQEWAQAFKAFRTLEIAQQKESIRFKEDDLMVFDYIDNKSAFSNHFSNFVNTQLKFDEEIDTQQVIYSNPQLRNLMNENVFLKNDILEKNKIIIPKLRLNFNETQQVKEEDLSSPHENLETLPQQDFNCTQEQEIAQNFAFEKNEQNEILKDIKNRLELSDGMIKKIKQNNIYGTIQKQNKENLCKIESIHQTDKINKKSIYQNIDQKVECYQDFDKNIKNINFQKIKSFNLSSTKNACHPNVYENELMLDDQSSINHSYQKQILQHFKVDVKQNQFQEKKNPDVISQKFDQDIKLFQEQKFDNVQRQSSKQLTQEDEPIYQELSKRTYCKTVNDNIDGGREEIIRNQMEQIRNENSEEIQDDDVNAHMLLYQQDFENEVFDQRSESRSSSSSTSHHQSDSLSPQQQNYYHQMSNQLRQVIDQDQIGKSFHTFTKNSGSFIDTQICQNKSQIQQSFKIGDEDNQILSNEDKQIQQKNLLQNDNRESLLNLSKKQIIYDVKNQDNKVPQFLQQKQKKLEFENIQKEIKNNSIYDNAVPKSQLNHCKSQQLPVTDIENYDFKNAEQSLDLKLNLSNISSQLISQNNQQASNPIDKQSQNQIIKQVQQNQSNNDVSPSKFIFTKNQFQDLIDIIPQEYHSLFFSQVSNLQSLELSLKQIQDMQNMKSFEDQKQITSERDFAKSPLQKIDDNESQQKIKSQMSTWSNQMATNRLLSDNTASQQKTQNCFMQPYSDILQKQTEYINQTNLSICKSNQNQKANDFFVNANFQNHFGKVNGFEDVDNQKKKNEQNLNHDQFQILQKISILKQIQSLLPDNVKIPTKQKNTFKENKQMNQFHNKINDNTDLIQFEEQNYNNNYNKNFGGISIGNQENPGQSRIFDQIINNIKSSQNSRGVGDEIKNQRKIFQQKQLMRKSLDVHTPIKNLNTENRSLSMNFRKNIFQNKQSKNVLEPLLRGQNFYKKFSNFETMNFNQNLPSFDPLNSNIISPEACGFGVRFLQLDQSLRFIKIQQQLKNTVENQINVIDIYRVILPQQTIEIIKVQKQLDFTKRESSQSNTQKRKSFNQFQNQGNSKSNKQNKQLNFEIELSQQKSVLDEKNEQRRKTQKSIDESLICTKKSRSSQENNQKIVKQKVKETRFYPFSIALKFDDQQLSNQNIYEMKKSGGQNDFSQRSNCAHSRIASSNNINSTRSRTGRIDLIATSYDNLREWAAGLNFLIENKKILFTFENN